MAGKIMPVVEKFWGEHLFREEKESSCKTVSVQVNVSDSKYHTRIIITRNLYTFYPLFEVQKRFFKGLFLKILALCMVSIQEQFLIKSGL